MKKAKQQPRKEGRPTIYDSKVAGRICMFLERGAFRRTAAIMAGISPRTMDRWLAEGRDNPDSELGDFRRSVEEAEARAESELSDVVFSAGLQDANYALRYLSIRHGKRWSERQRLEHTGKDGGPIKLQRDLSGLTDEELETIESIYRAADARRSEGGTREA